MVIRRYLAWGAAALAAGLMLFLRWGGTALCVLLLCCLALGLIRPLRPLWRPLLCGLMAAALVGGMVVKNAAGKEGRVLVKEDLPPRPLPTFENALEPRKVVDESNVYAKPAEQKQRFEEWALEAPAPAEKPAEAPAPAPETPAAPAAPAAKAAVIESPVVALPTAPEAPKTAE